MVSGGSESKALATLRDERDRYESLFETKAQECAELAQVNAQLKEKVSWYHISLAGMSSLSPSLSLPPSLYS